VVETPSPSSADATGRYQLRADERNLDSEDSGWNDVRHTDFGLPQAQTPFVHKTNSSFGKVPSVPSWRPLLYNPI
jgi:hypothetical protein